MTICKQSYKFHSCKMHRCILMQGRLKPEHFVIYRWVGMKFMRQYRYDDKNECNFCTKKMNFSFFNFIILLLSKSKFVHVRILGSNCFCWFKWDDKDVDFNPISFNSTKVVSKEQHKRAPVVFAETKIILHIFSFNFRNVSLFYCHCGQICSDLPRSFTARNI